MQNSHRLIKHVPMPMAHSNSQKIRIQNQTIWLLHCLPFESMHHLVVRVGNRRSCDCNFHFDHDLFHVIRNAFEMV